MFQRLTVAMRLGLGFGLLLAMMVLMSLIGNYQVGFIDRTLLEVREGASVKQRHAINFRGSVHDRAIAIRDAVLVRQPTDLNQHLRNVERLDRFYQDSARAMDNLFASTKPTREEQTQLAAIKAIEQRTLDLTDRLMELRQSGDTEQARVFLLTEVSGAYSEWLGSINAFIDHQEELIAADIDRVQAAAGGF